MSKCPGLHCPKCPDSGGGIGAIVAALVVLGLAARYGAAVVAGAVELVAIVLRVVLITAASLAGLAVTAGGVWAGLRIRAHRRQRASVSWQMGRTALDSPERPAIGPPSVVPGIVIRPAGERPRARVAARPLPRGQARPGAPAWPRTRPDGTREPR
jgi:hypothetical protein